MTRSPLDDFLVAATVPRTGLHADGTIARAELLRASLAAPADMSIHAAAVLGDADAIARFLETDPSDATRAGGPHGWDPLTYLCFSNYLKLDRGRDGDFVRAATLLLDAGADANTGFFEPGHAPSPMFESALYGACGVAHHAPLTSLLLARGADPNDDEVPYHAPETYDNAALEVLVSSGRLTADSLTTLLLRKSDWHDLAGARYLLAHGADPRRASRWARNILLHAISRDNALPLVEALLDHGADPREADLHGSAFAAAAGCGRGDLLRAFAARGFTEDLAGTDALVAACALADSESATRIARDDPATLAALRARVGTLLARFAGVGNHEGIALLLDLGLPVEHPLDPVRGYFTIVPGSRALHVAAWRARHETVALLLDRGADANARASDGSTPLSLAVRACVDSYWADRRRPDSVARLLAAGASVAGVPFPSGYDAIDALLLTHGTPQRP